MMVDNYFFGLLHNVQQHMIWLPCNTWNQLIWDVDFVITLFESLPSETNFYKICHLKFLTNSNKEVLRHSFFFHFCQGIQVKDYPAHFAGTLILCLCLETEFWLLSRL